MNRRSLLSSMCVLALVGTMSLEPMKKKKIAVYGNFFNDEDEFELIGYINDESELQAFAQKSFNKVRTREYYTEYNTFHDLHPEQCSPCKYSENPTLTVEKVPNEKTLNIFKECADTFDEANETIINQSYAMYKGRNKPLGVPDELADYHFNHHIFALVKV